MHSVCPFTAPATTRSLRNNGFGDTRSLRINEIDNTTKTSLKEAAKTGLTLQV